MPGSGAVWLLRGNATVMLRPKVTETYDAVTDEYVVTVSTYGNPVYPLTPLGTTDCRWHGECLYYDLTGFVAERAIKLKN